MTSLNIINLIENNPITRLSNTYQNKLLTKIKEKFTDKEQQLFVSSFYCYLKYENDNDFIIDLDDIWKWLGFQCKYNSKRLLEKYFTLDKDYKILLSQSAEQSNHAKGGHNKETIMLTITTFKKYCLKAGTKKADEIHDYYIKLEKTLHEVINEESNELKLELEQKKLQIENQIVITEKEKHKLREKTLLEQFSNNTQCVYYGIIDNVNDKNEKLIKFGNSNNLKSRVITHRDTYSNFCLINAFKVDNKFQIENALKENQLFNERRRNIIIKGKKYLELLNIDGITFTELDKVIKEIITSIEFSPENYIKILEENKVLKREAEQKNNDDNTHNLILSTAENKRLKFENINLIAKYNTLKKRTKATDEDIIINQELLSDMSPKMTQNIPSNTIENYRIIVNNFKKKYRHKDGKYYIDEKIYDKLNGTRKEVWDNIAYQTTGLLLKKDLMLNKEDNKIVSKKKSIQETINNRFEKYGVKTKIENIK